MQKQDKTPILQRLAEKIAAGRPILCAGAADSASVRHLENAGSDLLFITSGLGFAHANDLIFGMLPFAEANASVLEIAKTLLPDLKHTPVIAGICATDPTYGRAHFLRQLQRLGLAGIQNDPSLGLFDGEYRAHLEGSGMCYSQEVDSIASARETGLLTVGNVFSTDEARLMMKAGADIILAHLDLFPAIGDPQDAIPRIQELSAVCKAFRQDVIILLRLAKQTSFDDLQRVLDSCPSIAGLQFPLRLSDFPSESDFLRAFLNYKKLSLAPTDAVAASSSRRESRQ
jgi:predicted TIM-barrel enzyme